MLNKIKSFLPKITIAKRSPGVETVDQILGSLSVARQKLLDAQLAHGAAATAHGKTALEAWKAAEVSRSQAVRCERAANKINDIIG
jgi:hypothetical protein